MTEGTRFFWNLVLTVVGSGLGTALIGTWFKNHFDAQLETQKALLQRTGKIHEKQVDALLSIQANLDAALFYLQRTTSAGKTDVPDAVWFKRAGERLAAASETFSQSRLLFSGVLEQKLDEFFNKSNTVGVNLRIAQDPALSGMEKTRTVLLEKAANAAHSDLPAILKVIRDEARAVIHG